MKKHYASILLTIASLIGGVSALGLEQPEVVVTVPFDFAAGGKTLPAGTYVVTRLWEDSEGLSVISYKIGSGAFVMASQFDSHRLDNPKVTFKQVGDTHFLRSIQSRDGVYTVASPRMMNVVAGNKHTGSMSASGTN